MSHLYTKHKSYTYWRSFATPNTRPTVVVACATQKPVPSAVRSFLNSWRSRTTGAIVHIITGKGKGSANGPVLRGLVKSLLQGELRSLVARGISTTARTATRFRSNEPTAAGSRILGRR